MESQMEDQVSGLIHFDKKKWTIELGEEGWRGTTDD